MKDRKDLIDALSSDLAAVKPAPSAALLALVWGSLSALYVVAVTHLFGPLRPHALHDLTTEPHFLAETLLGVAALTVTALIGFRSAIPGALSRPLAITGGLLLVLWIGAYVLGLFHPALEPSMEGKRMQCYIETLLYAMPPLIAGLLLSKRLYPLQPGRAGLWLGLTAGLMPALYMQLACMYDPAHILSFHIAPGLVAGALGVPIAWWVLAKR